MKTLNLLTLCACLAASLLVGCKTTGTSSTTELFNPAGDMLARHKEKTRTTGVMVNSQTANPQGSISYTNFIQLPNGFTFQVTETKDFKAGAANYKADAKGIEAVGSAGGKLINGAMNPTPSTP